MKKKKNINVLKSVYASPNIANSRAQLSVNSVNVKVKEKKKDSTAIPESPIEYKNTLA